jgi:hypothetical protein
MSVMELEARTKKSVRSFYELFLRATESSNHPPKLKDYSSGEGWMLGLQLAMVLDPNLLKLSECNHRAVSATLSLHLKESPTKEDQAKAHLLLLLNNTIGHFFETSEGTFLVLHGNNNWRSRELDKKDILSCKTMPGHPTQVPRENLPHLSENLEVRLDSEIDNACPKRTKLLPCKIMHAEAAVINSAKEVMETLKLPASTKTILTSTWVPCPNCVELIIDNRVVFGSKIDIFSIYKAAGDKDDDEMASRIQNELHKDDLGKLSGPFIALPKTTPGYGRQKEVQTK